MSTAYRHPMPDPVALIHAVAQMLCTVRCKPQNVSRMVGMGMAVVFERPPGECWDAVATALPMAALYQGCAIDARLVADWLAMGDV